jgi:hypothetical protein
MTTNKYIYEYDDCGVLCRYTEELGEWECCECHCLNCGYPPEDCECETGFEEAPYIKVETECNIKPINDKAICNEEKEKEKEEEEEEEDKEDKEKLICSYCGRDEDECKRNTESEINPITKWMGGWGMSCDDCYYKNNPDTDEDPEDEKNEI